ncbi:MAG: sugar transporter [Prevotella sp.]|nr:sugar transporter [Prevotella sp.]
MADRMHKSLMNAKVGFIFYFLSIFLAFFSRRIFLDCLGADFIGLTGTIGSILSFLNLSEVGIGTCIGYFLYKPIEQGDRSKICEIVSLFGWLYRIVGSIILGGGIIISLFFPLIFAHENLPFGIIFFAFFSIIGSNVIGYFINYRQILLESDQKMYKISVWTKSGNIIKTIIQIVLAYNLKNLYIWVSVEFIFGLIVCWILNYVISREYPWLKTDKSKGKEILRKYPEILDKAKQIVIHRFKNFFLSKSDEILIFSFESLQMVTYYGNYIMIVGKLTELVNNLFVGMNASIGNLVAEGNKQNIRKVFWEFVTFRYWTTGIFIIGLCFLINPIISWWLGEQYILQNHIVFLILLNMYIMLTRPSIDLFINAYGLYDDVWAAYAEALINITITLIVGYLYGLVGILLGKIISMSIFVVLWKPYYLYHRGFNSSVNIYWKNIITHITILAGCIFLNYFIKAQTNWEISPTTVGLLQFAFCITLPIIILYSLFIYLLCPGGKDLVTRIKSIR